MKAAAPQGVSDEPMREDAKRITVLRRDNRIRRKRAHDHHHREGGDDKRQFVTDHLRDRAHCAQHGKLVVATPAGHEDGKLGG